MLVGDNDTYSLFSVTWENKQKLAHGYCTRDYKVFIMPVKFTVPKTAGSEIGLCSNVYTIRRSIVHIPITRKWQFLTFHIFQHMYQNVFRCVKVANGCSKDAKSVQLAVIFRVCVAKEKLTALVEMKSDTWTWCIHKCQCIFYSLYFNSNISEFCSWDYR